MPGGHRHACPGHPTRLGQEADQRVVGRALNRLGGQPNPNTAIVPACHRGGRGAGLHVEEEPHVGADLADGAQRLPTMSAVRRLRATIRRSQAASGLRSNIPNGGSTRWMGRTSQSVRT